MIAVEGVSGFDVGEVSLTGEIVRLQMKKRGAKEDNPEMKKVLRLATDRDLDYNETKQGPRTGSSDPQPGHCQATEAGYEDQPGGNAGRWKKSYFLLYCRWAC